jgi:hypothetical protein
MRLKRKAAGDTRVRGARVWISVMRPAGLSRRDNAMVNFGALLYPRPIGE